MALSSDFVTKEPTRAEIDALNAPTVLEFGTAPHRRAQALRRRVRRTTRIAANGSARPSRTWTISRSPSWL